MGFNSGFKGLICLLLLFYRLLTVALLIYSFSHIVYKYTFILHCFHLSYVFFTKFYTSMYRKESLYLKFLNNLCSFFHGLWYTDLIMDGKNVPKIATVAINCFAHHGTLQIHLYQILFLKKFNYFARRNTGTGIRLVSAYKYYTTKHFGCKIVTKLLYRLSYNYRSLSMSRLRIVTSTENINWGQSLEKDS